MLKVATCFLFMTTSIALQIDNYLCVPVDDSVKATPCIFKKISDKKGEPVDSAGMKTIDRISAVKGNNFLLFCSNSQTGK